MLALHGSGRSERAHGARASKHRPACLGDPLRSCRRLLFGTSLLALAPRPAAADEPALGARRTAIGAVLGLSSSGLALRHHWSERWGTEVSAYSTFGQKFGVLALSTQAQFTIKRIPSARVYAFAPFRWVYERKPTEQALNFGPDGKIQKLHLFRVGMGAGIELFLGPFVAISLELPFVLQLSSKATTLKSLEYLAPDTKGFMMAPNAGLHVYFR